MIEIGLLAALRRAIIDYAVDLVIGEEPTSETLAAVVDSYRDELSIADRRFAVTPTLFPMSIREWEDTVAYYAILHVNNHRDDGSILRRAVIGYLAAKKHTGRGDAADHLEQVLACASHIGPRNVDEPDIDPLSYAGPFD